MFLASALIVPVGISYATYGNSPGFATSNPSTPSTNQTMTMHPEMTNQTMTMHPAMTNQTMTMHPAMTNQTMTMHPLSTASTNVASQPITPLKQVKTGVAPKSVQCQSGFSLVLKAEDGSPACVHSPSVQILIQRGWAAIQ